MIGKSVYYIEFNQVKKSEVVATELREFKNEKKVILTLRSGYRVELKRACFRLYDLLMQLKRDFEEIEYC